MSWKNKVVFVSGGAGTIGLPLVRLLHDGGAKVIVGDKKERPEEFPASITYRKGDLNDLKKGEISCDLFFHLAATFERSEESSTFFQEGWNDNIRLSHHLLETVVAKRIVFASSYLVYDPKVYMKKGAPLLKEDAPISPRNLCGFAKYYHEGELQFYRDHFDVSSVSARIFRVYGRGSKDVIGRFVTAAKRGEALTLWGKEGRFDYIFADDVAKGLVLLGASTYQGVVNLGTGKGRKVGDIVRVLQGKFTDLRVQETAYEGALEDSVADIALLEKICQWRPEISLEEGIARLL